MEFTVYCDSIASTTTKPSFTVKCGVDDKICETEIKIGDNEFGYINMIENPFHGERNYVVVHMGNM